MKITILAVGNKLPSWVNEASTQYIKRFKHDISLQLKEIKPEKRTPNNTAEQAMLHEEQRIREHIPAQSYLVVLDEKGHRPTSVEFAKLLEKWQDTSLNPCFVIGGADGISTSLKQDAQLILQLSNMTLPHGLARILLLEQLYRATSILNNHPYHRT